MKKHETRFIVILAIFIALALFILPRVWAVNVPLNIDLRGAFGRTCEQVTLEVRAWNTTMYTIPYTNINSITATLSLGTDTSWTVVVAVRPEASDSLTTWSFAYNYWFSGGTKLFTTPAYWNFPTDSVVLDFSLNGNTQALRKRTGVQSWDTSFVVQPYGQYVAKYSIYAPGNEGSQDWIWSFWADTVGGGGQGPQTVGDANYALVYGTVLGQDGQPVVGAQIEAVRVSATNAALATSTGTKIIVSPVTLTATTNTAGYFYMPLLRSNQYSSTGDMKYNIRGTYDGVEIFSLKNLTIPSTGNINVADTIAVRQ